MDDVIVDDLPHGQPPLRGIKHAIDLVPQVPLLNKPPYRCDPVASRELLRQIEELTEKGNVIESWVYVLFLLVPKKVGTSRVCVLIAGSS